MIDPCVDKCTPVIPKVLFHYNLCAEYMCTKFEDIVKNEMILKNLLLKLKQDQNAVFIRATRIQGCLECTLKLTTQMTYLSYFNVI